MGDYDLKRDKLVATDHDKFNFGAASPSGVHAPSASPDGKGGLIVIFNMNPGLPTTGWNQIMTLPRRLYLNRGGDVLTEPAGDLKSLRGEHMKIKKRTIPANQDIVLEGIEGNAIEIAAEIATNQSPMVELNVLRSQDGTEKTRILFFRERGFRNTNDKGTRLSLLTIDSSYSSILPDAQSRAPETGMFELDSNENLKLDIFVDKSVVEVFANGKKCVAMRVYPGREDSTGVSIRSAGRDVELVSLDMWQMENIYN